MLIVVTPLAIGAVSRRAFVAMELAISALFLIQITRSAGSRFGLVSGPLPMRAVKHLSLPFVAIAGLLIVQLIPLPPPVVRLLSPTTYHIYQIAFAGWPYDHKLPPWSRSSDSESPPSRTAEPLRHSSIVYPLAGRGVAGVYPLEVPKWRPLTVSASATSASLIEFLALVSIFYLVLLCPFGTASRERPFVQSIIYSVIATGTLVALLAIAERAWWNGKVLWFYQPADWKGPLLVASPRARGPFVNPDHFANFLALILPLAVSITLFPHSIANRGRSNSRLFFGCAAIAMLIAAALSLSRGGWLAISIGIGTMLIMCFSRASSASKLFWRSGLRGVPSAIVTFVFVIGVTLYVIGRPARIAVAMRLATTSPSDFAARVDAWHATLTMIRDFPMLGVGAGSWPDIFPHYQPPPVSHYYFYRTAENDYLQFIAENGLVGLAALVALSIVMIRILAVAGPRISAQRWPLFAGLIGGTVGALIQEFVDSSLHIPANALIFSVLLALLLRVAVADSPAVGDDSKAAVAIGLATPRWLLASAYLIIVVAAWNQDGGVYPYAVDHPANLTIARRNLADHPATSAVHLALARMMPDLSEAQRIELAAAVWLDPNEPLARDLLARNLLLSGRKSQALAEVSASVYHAPFQDLHYYLAPSAVLWLLPEQQQAVADGFSRSIDSGFGDAVPQLASFYLGLGRVRDAAQAWESGARMSADRSRRMEFLLEAAQQYARLHDYVDGARLLLEARTVAPADPQPYVELARIYGEENNLTAASAAVDQGIRAGADPYPLEMALASAAERTGLYQIAETALVRALGYDPSFEATLRLGRVYFDENRFERAVGALLQAIDLNRHSAEAFMWLGRAYEASYDYNRAARAFHDAIALAPNNEVVRTQYSEFEHRLAEQSRDDHN
jgi:O-antigen ligase/tetratricopeptide (TPR) repeat protein